MQMPICDSCKHLLGDSMKERCKAFPNGIPAEAYKLSGDENVECAPGIKYESKNPELEHKQPDENSVLSKMLHQFR